MVIDHAGCLHVRVNDGGTHEFKAPFFEVLGPFQRFIGKRRVILEGLHVAYDRLVGDPGPHVLRK